MSNVVDLVALRAELRRARVQNRVVVRLLDEVVIADCRFEAGRTVALAPALAREMIAKGLARPAGNTR